MHLWQAYVANKKSPSAYLKCDKTCLLLGSDNYLLPFHSQIIAGETVEAWKVLNVAGGGVEAGSVPGATHAAFAQTTTQRNNRVNAVTMPIWLLNYDATNIYFQLADNDCTRDTRLRTLSPAEHRSACTWAQERRTFHHRLSTEHCRAHPATPPSS